ncbi:BKACE family enzyme [Tritonibacter aquimaris]|uniref:3-keto-5-aminohexanoate cleavage protein n=1 Tax=Tritonibacter aquimaris TaxID=2663379 RepID=UPI001885FD24|nr:3-keto-5-aminohexanoate cleavage protein [Tritonibacter aquimaris]
MTDQDQHKPQHEGGRMGGLSQMAPAKVTVAPNGARRQKADHPDLPLSVVEIAQTAKSCWDAGADEIHLHVREADGAHSLSVDLYQQAIAAVRHLAPGLAVQVTTEAAGRYAPAEQFALLQELRPSSASISVREICRTPEITQDLYGFCNDARIKVQHILYSLEDLELLRQLLECGDVPDDMRDILLVFGKYNPARDAQSAEVAPFVQALGDDFPNWTVCAFGPHEHDVAAEALRLGGHVRIGFENNIHGADGELARDNAQNISRIVQAARAMGRSLLKDQQS